MSKHEKKMSFRQRMYWKGYSAKETIMEFWTFLRRMNGYRKLDRDYGYDPDTFRFIIDNYSEVLCSRTKVMSKPTYYAEDVIGQLDEWYDEHSRGYWIEEPLKEGDCAREIWCSECGEIHLVNRNIPYKDWCSRWNYCHRCGVKTEEKR